MEEAFARRQTEQIIKEKERKENRRCQDMEAAQRAADHKKWLKDIGATSTTLDTLDKYKEAKHNKAEEYQLFRGYGRAVEKGDINGSIKRRQRMC